MHPLRWLAGGPLFGSAPPADYCPLCSGPLDDPDDVFCGVCRARTEQERRRPAEDGEDDGDS